MEYITIARVMRTLSPRLLGSGHRNSEETAHSPVCPPLTRWKVSIFRTLGHSPLSQVSLVVEGVEDLFPSAVVVPHLKALIWTT